MNADALTAWLRRSALVLEQSVDALTDRQWSAEVVTAQERTVRAIEIPWLRSREVLIHAVDLGLGVGFADLPDDFLDALVAEICTKRGLSSNELPGGPIPEVAAWLAGRPNSLAATPVLGPWP